MHPYLARQLSMFSTGNIFRGLRTRSKSMMDTGDKDLDRFRPSGEVIPYVLYWCIIILRRMMYVSFFPFSLLFSSALRGLPAPLIKDEKPSYMAKSQPSRLGFP